jgi:uncharacterized cupredoxin-like copper-binding protein
MRPVHFALSVAAVVSLLGCGGAGATSAPSAAGGPSSSGGTQVAAEEKEFSIGLDKTTVPSGNTTFSIRNTGTVVHEFVVVDTDTAAGALPQANGEVDEAQLQVVDEVEDLGVGASSTLTVNLAPGHYAIICNVPGHYAGGMHVDLTVQ